MNGGQENGHTVSLMYGNVVGKSLRQTTRTAERFTTSQLTTYVKYFFCGVRVGRSW